MSLFDNYSEDKAIRTFGTDTCKKLKSNRIRKPFCNIALDPDKKRDNRSAFVVSTARLTDESQKIYYLLKWDSPDSVPAGNHLGQQIVDYSGRFVEDKDAKGRPITIPMAGVEVFYENNIFYFVDNILQDRDMRGRWTFMILVCDKDGNELCKKSIDLNW